MKLSKQFQVLDMVEKQKIDRLRFLCDLTIEQIQREYWGEEPNLSISNHISSITPVGRLFSVLFFNEEVRNIVDNAIKRIISNRFDTAPEELYRCPVYVMRVFLGNDHISEGHRRALLQTEPHFDNAFGLNGVSAWIPFHDVGREDGGLCYFDDESFLGNSIDGKNVLNFEKYYDNYHKYDQDIMTRLMFKSVEKGQCILHSKILHGALKTRKNRYSFNVRYVAKRDVMNMANKSERDLYISYNEDFDKARLDHMNRLRLEANRYYDNLKLDQTTKYKQLHYTNEFEVKK